MKQKKLDKAFQDTEKSLEDTHTLCQQIQGKFTDIREKLIRYQERRRARYAQFLSDRDYNLLLALVLCALAAMLLDKYSPAWLDLFIWVALLAALISVVMHRIFRKAY